MGEWDDLIIKSVSICEWVDILICIWTKTLLPDLVNRFYFVCCHLMFGFTWNFNDISIIWKIESSFGFFYCRNEFEKEDLKYVTPYFFRVNILHTLWSSVSPFTEVYKSEIEKINDKIYHNIYSFINIANKNINKPEMESI